MPFACPFGFRQVVTDERKGNKVAKKQSGEGTAGARPAADTGGTAKKRPAADAGSAAMKRPAANVRDMAEKTLEAFDDVHADIVNVLVFGGKRRVLEEELEQATLRSVYKADGRLREQERDGAKYWGQMNVRMALIGLENQTEPEDDVPLRIIGYDGAAYRDQLYYVKDKNGKRRMNDNPRYPVLTLVLYFGYEKHWNKPLSLHEALPDLPEEWKPYVNDYRVHLFEIAWLSEEQVSMFQSDFRIIADYFVQMRKRRDYNPPEIPMAHPREVLQLMSTLTGDERFERALHEREKGREVENMCEVLDRIETRGIQKGIEQGKRQGMKQGMKQGRIMEFVDLRREDGFAVEEILQGLMKKFGLSAKQAKEFVKE